jgi:hypothetical protein
MMTGEQIYRVLEQYHRTGNGPADGPRIVVHREKCNLDSINEDADGDTHAIPIRSATRQAGQDRTTWYYAYSERTNTLYIFTWHNASPLERELAEQIQHEQKRRQSTSD